MIRLIAFTIYICFAPPITYGIVRAIAFRHIEKSLPECESDRQ